MTLAQFLTAEAKRLHARINSLDKARFFSKHAAFVAAANAPWLAVPARYTLIQRTAIENQWQHRNAGDTMPELPEWETEWSYLEREVATFGDMIERIPGLTRDERDAITEIMMADTDYRGHESHVGSPVAENIEDMGDCQGDA